MGESDEPGPVTEPLVMPDAFATDVKVEPIDGNIRIVGLVEVGEERRVVGRMVVPESAARQLVADLRRILMRGGN